MNEFKWTIKKIFSCLIVESCVGSCIDPIIDPVNYVRQGNILTHEADLP